MTRTCLVWSTLGLVWLASIAIVASASTVAGAAELYDAVQADDVQRAQFLILQKVNVNESGPFGAPLQLAVARGSMAIVRALIEAGADLEAEGMGRTRPLHTAAYLDRVEAAALLIEHGAKLDARDSEGMTPLLIAASNGHPGIVRLLLDAGADLRAEDGHYHDAAIHLAVLSYAALADRLEVIKLLLSRGADINLRSGHGGETALFYITSTVEVPKPGRLEMTRFLLANGADPNIAAKNGKTVYEACREPAVCDVLRRFRTEH